MYIQKVTVKNFRLLENIDFSLEERTTVIVGRNNSGKTSLTELFRRLFSDPPLSFCLEDFSLSVHEKFWLSYQQFSAGEEEINIRSTLPAIEVRLSVDYTNNILSYGPLSEFIIDLDPNCTEAIINVRYELEQNKLFSLFEDIDHNKAAFFKALKDRIPKLYVIKRSAEDPNDPTNQKNIDANQLQALLQLNVINAQRGLDGIHRGGVENNILGAILEGLFTTASISNNGQDQKIIADLKEAIQNIQQGVDYEFNVQLDNLFPTFLTFGYPGLSDPNLRTETTFDVERLLRNHTKVHYAGVNGINLPEAYNGLGTRNLIYILLQLWGFYKVFTVKDSMPGMHLIFIEEPEAHLHPQMQEVFIAKLEAIAGEFANTFGGGVVWPVQFVVTTHSPHIANKASFEAMRYFLTCSQGGAENIRLTKIKDLKKDLTETLKPDKEFLHKYMTLTGCDLLFADKVVLIEGATERIMLPEIISKVDAICGSRLSSQYISVMEVGGAHAHKFFALLNFLELRTLIITDIDSIGKNKEACEVATGEKISNSCIKKWFNNSNITPTELLKKKEDEKIDGHIRIAYQIPEQGMKACGRSFEDAFILANLTIFNLATADSTQAFNKAKNIKKTDFAIQYGVDNPDWKVPFYILEGLSWLAVPPTLPLQQNHQNSEDRELTCQLIMSD